MKLGLKLWSDNDHYIKHASELYKEGYFDYIELYVVKGTIDRYLGLWQDMKIPYVIHNAHSDHGFNLAVREKKEENLRLFNEARSFADKLRAPYIIVHPGVLGDHGNVKEQLSGLNDSRILIENKPHLALNKMGICAGASPKKIAEYCETSGAGFCLDVNHAVNYALHNKKDHSATIELFMAMKPVMMHISGIDRYSEVDKHLHLKDGNIDIREVFNKVKGKGIQYCTIETPKGSKEDLDDFKEDAEYLKGILKAGI